MCQKMVLIFNLLPLLVLTVTLTADADAAASGLRTDTNIEPLVAENGDIAVSLFSRSLPVGIAEQMVVRNPATGAIYRVENGRLRHFANPNSYNAAGAPKYTEVEPATLANIPIGESISLLPAGISEEMVVRNPTNGAIYRVEGGKLRHYADPTTYNAAGAPKYRNIDPAILAEIPLGESISTLPGGINEMTVRNPTTGAIYRLEGGKLRHYVNPMTYNAAGEPKYTNIDPAILAVIPLGENISTLPAGIGEEMIVRNPNNGAIYRVQDGKLRHFVNPFTYAAAGSPKFTNIDESILVQIPTGAGI